MIKYTPSYCKGKDIARVAFVFICPGQEEENKGKPVAGQTGKNLETLLYFLNQSIPTEFPTTQRYDYRILNLSDKIFYKEKTGMSTPPVNDIDSEENIKRIIGEIGNCEIIIFFSKNKKYAKVIEKIKIRLNSNQKTMRVMHLGFQSINRGVKCDKLNNPIIRGDKEGTFKRLEVIAEDINCNFLSLDDTN
ncbi:hypothetical protein [Streptococcus saliviloxodontae]|uniref:Uracil-DNA glycosylase-like domain-containing protein n=1 Tax=Streptococcus saliviloxodontae TaxID=1349416 RepID=A0ABS2PJB5_9STRE|nr:hypothetical protein [Streptococcus saliviloxodontae]MBM7635525.1 hypothetical protein [Streptococcus saliviloxodontae]